MLCMCVCGSKGGSPDGICTLSFSIIFQCPRQFYHNSLTWVRCSVFH